MRVLGRQIIKKDFTSPGESPFINGDSPNLYSGTFSLLATLFPSILQRSRQVTFHVTHKTLKNPHWKGLEVHVSPFSMQR
jgi:hypothetical protein